MESAQQFLSETFANAWDTFKRDPVLYVVGAMIVGFVSVASLGILAGPLTVGFMRVVKRKREGQPAGLGDVFDFTSFGASLGVVVLVLLAAALGCVLLVVPGLLVLLFSSFALCEVAYGYVGAIDALLNSARMVKRHFLDVVLLTLSVWAVNVVGGSIMLGALFAAPFGVIMFVVAYERLAKAESTFVPLIGHFEPPPAPRV